MSPTVTNATEAPHTVATPAARGVARQTQPSAETRPFFSLVLATYGRTDQLGAMLDSLRTQLERSFEVLVVDQNPDDRIAPFLHRLDDLGVRVARIRMPEANLSAARNLGVASACGECVAFPDDDCWYEPEALARTRSALEAEPDLDGVVARWVEATPADTGNVSRMLTLDAWRRFRGGDASSIALFLRRRAVVQLGGFDPRVGVGRWYGAGEETDLLLRMLAAGARIRTVPNARVRHRAPVGPSSFSFDQWQGKRSRERGVGALYAKHRLSPIIVMRGLVAPVVSGFRRRESVSRLAGVLYGVAAMLGRIEGMTRWLRRERYDHRDNPSCTR